MSTSNITPASQWSAMREYSTTFFKMALPAIATIPFERLAVHRILASLKNDKDKPIAYLHVIKKDGWKGMFKGGIGRAGYCFAGNGLTLLGLKYVGCDVVSLMIIAAGKNILVPVSLWNNARQNGDSRSEAYQFVKKGSKDWITHLGFMARNAGGILCVALGVNARDFTLRFYGGEESSVPTTIGLITTTATSTIMNIVLKPLFTGKHPLKDKIRVVAGLTAGVAITAREFLCAVIVLCNSSPKSDSKR